MYLKLIDDNLASSWYEIAAWPVSVLTMIYLYSGINRSWRIEVRNYEIS